ncbi:MAG TPA: YggS family pyridoxal phosphate-dependent enzyme [Clostridiales bacterium]|nr:YggS family pyridoxal phosphate-dependent enzyme [Clostridiales bacterium]
MQEKLSNSHLKKLQDVEYNYKTIEEQIVNAAEKSGRHRKDIAFMAATKTVDAEIINHAISLGLKYIGENKVQELLSKYDYYNLDNCSLQLIGHLQTNKVRQIVGKVDMIQSVDSLKLATEIGKQSEKNNITTDILLEVNIGREESKSGVMPEQLEELLCQIRTIDGISIRGLMSIPPICEKKSEISQYFALMNKLFIDIKDKKMDNVSMDYLSMGMSSDYYEAILNGANMVRVGSSLFGARIYR